VTIYTAVRTRLCNRIITVSSMEEDVVVSSALKSNQCTKLILITIEQL
jgi:hypothetical protein